VNCNRGVVKPPHVCRHPNRYLALWCRRIGTPRLRLANTSLTMAIENADAMSLAPLETPILKVSR
jgi:hypothetical protein